MLAPTSVEIIACICHQVNKSICEFHGDHSQKDWNECDEWQKESAIAGVEEVLKNPDITSEEIHDKWMLKKAEDGWKFGKEKCPEKKTHPCMIPYEELPEEQRLKDSCFNAVCNAMRHLK